jgi:hypothetical protein
VDSCIPDITRLLEAVETFLEYLHHVRVARVFESYGLLHVNIGIDLVEMNEQVVEWVVECVVE